MSFLQPSNTKVTVSSKRVLIEPSEVDARLSELHPTLDQDLLIEANLRGYEARLEATEAHPPTAAGSLHWHEFVGALRTALMQIDWIKKNHKNCPFIISPDDVISLLIMTGDSETGKVDGNPSNQADKGSVLNAAVLNNSNYELFENSAISTLNRGDSGTQLWVLLYHVEKNPNGTAKEIRAELSLPSSFQKKKIVGWTERIILRKIEFGRAPELEQHKPIGPIDIPIERRNAG